jgi:hypothetical protein
LNAEMGKLEKREIFRDPGILGGSG